MQRILENPAAASHHWRKKLYACSMSNRFDERSGNKIAGRQNVDKIQQFVAGYAIARYLAHYLSMIFAICIFFIVTRQFLYFACKNAWHGAYKVLFMFIHIIICITNNKTYMMRCLNYIGQFLHSLNKKWDFIFPSCK